MRPYGVDTLTRRPRLKATVKLLGAKNKIAVTRLGNTHGLLRQAGPDGRLLWRERDR
jgi:hypothetical protein